MKNLSLIFTLLFLGTWHLQAQEATITTESFKVYGNCGSCEKRIEKAASSVSGVDLITVRYDATKTNVPAIKKAIAASGYDTEEFRAPEAAYSNLPACCQYDRPAAPAATDSAVDVQGVQASFTVYGNCGMCKRRIEGALKDVPGVLSAVWNKDTKQLALTYDEKTISLDEVQQRIAAAGHDTDKYRADAGKYSNLPGCCQYDRPQN